MDLIATLVGAGIALVSSLGVLWLDRFLRERSERRLLLRAAYERATAALNPVVDHWAHKRVPRYAADIRFEVARCFDQLLICAERDDREKIRDWAKRADDLISGEDDSRVDFPVVNDVIALAHDLRGEMTDWYLSTH